MRSPTPASRTTAGKAILVLGAGPTARSCIVAFATAGAHVTIWNRTAATARAIADRLNIAVWNSTDDTPNAVISALPPNVTIDASPLRDALIAAPIVIDANYGQRATLGDHLEREVHDGDAMLRASAAASFAIFKAAIKSKP